MAKQIVSMVGKGILIALAVSVWASWILGIIAVLR